MYFTDILVHAICCCVIIEKKAAVAHRFCLLEAYGDISRKQTPVKMCPNASKDFGVAVCLVGSRMSRVLLKTLEAVNKVCYQLQIIDLRRTLNNKRAHTTLQAAQSYFATRQRFNTQSETELRYDGLTQDPHVQKTFEKVRSEMVKTCNNKYLNISSKFSIS